MSPVPLIELQRRLSLVGAIRAGGQKPERGVGRKLENWRITSQRRNLVEQAAELYGGAVSEWQSPVGTEWQVYTETPELPILLMPNFSLRTTYELWEGATKRTRLCDGTDEELSGGPCLCNNEGIDRCDMYTRLIVALPELDTMLGWRVISKGANAAHELPMMVDAARATTSAPFVPARLHLEQRRGVKDGQVVRYVVPVLDLGVGYAALAGASAITPGRPALEAAPTSEQPNAAVIDHPRRAAAFGPVSISPDQASAPEVPENGGEPEQQTKAASHDQKTKLDVLVGKLRDQQKVLTTDGLYNAIGHKTLRNIGGLDIAMTTPDYVDKDGVVHKAIDPDDPAKLHWAPLRETLTRLEAHTLIEWLVKLEAREAPATPAEPTPEAPASPSDDVPKGEDPQPQQIVVPYNEFPPGY